MWRRLRRTLYHKPPNFAPTKQVARPNTHTSTTLNALIVCHDITQQPHPPLLGNTAGLCSNPSNFTASVFVSSSRSRILSNACSSSPENALPPVSISRTSKSRSVCFNFAVSS